MNTLLIKNVFPVCPSLSSEEAINIFIEKGVITYIGTEEKNADASFDGSGKYVSLGWMDMRSSFCDPGFEYKEDLNSGLNCAINGGFTAVCVLPNTDPVVDTKEVVSYINQKTKEVLPNVYPFGAVTQKLKGTALSEMHDMHSFGVKAFTDGHKTIWHTGILLKALQYVSPFNGLIINKPFDKYLMSEGLVHEGVNSTMVGMSGIPTITETMAIQHDLDILRYAGGRLHFTTISSESGVKLIRNAKKEGLNVTCDVAVHQLIYTDDVIASFDTNLKVNPPFRLESDKKALIEGVKDGTIDCIVSDHIPQDEECKKLEFDYAEFGMLNLETLYAQLSAVFTKEVLVNAIAVNPREILGLDLPEIKVGSVANLTVFDPDLKWEFKKSKSKSKNSKLLGTELKGRAIALVNGEKFQTIHS